MRKLIISLLFLITTRAGLSAAVKRKDTVTSFQTFSHRYQTLFGKEPLQKIWNRGSKVRCGCGTCVIG